MNTRNIKTVLLWLMTVAWTIFMFSLSGQPAEESARLSGGLTQFLLDLFSIPQALYGEFEHILRKLAHFCLFGVEGFLIYNALFCSLCARRKAVGISAAACVVLAALNEYHQTFFEGRSCELRDVLIDSAGAWLGIITALLLRHCYLLMKSRRQA